MEKFIMKPDLIYEMGQRGQKRAINEFDIETKVNKLVDFYQPIFDKDSKITS